MRGEEDVYKRQTQGFVSITGGAFSINAGDDAVQAKTYIGITGGTFSVTSADDAFHSDLQMAIAGGEFMAVSYTHLLLFCLGKCLPVDGDAGGRGGRGVLTCGQGRAGGFVAKGIRLLLRGR